MSRIWMWARRDPVPVVEWKPTVVDRIVAALFSAPPACMLGIAAGFWLAPDHSMTLITIVWLAGASRVLGAVLGAAFPKVFRCLMFFPFCFLEPCGARDSARKD